jgi:signal transduction histidine kinase
MKQVLINLLRNAAEAIDKPDGQIEIALGQEDGQALVCIADNGSGIPSDQLDRIFEPFYTTKGAEGTGLGLDIVREIITSHEGTIDVDSEPGRGTTFTIRLPTARSRTSVELQLEKENQLEDQNNFK